MTEERIIAYHFLPDSGMVKRLDIKAEVGLTITHEGPIRICDSGLHGSVRVIDALKYAPGSLVSIVEIWGDIQTQNDKVCGRNRKILKMIDATKVLHLFACNEAQLILDFRKNKGLKVDGRSYEAIRVKLLWLEGKATDQELATARKNASAAAADAAAASYASAAASYAAAAAAAAAADAAAAASYASAAASYAAAAAAAYAAAAAVRDKYKSEQNTRLETMLKDLFNE